MINQSKRLHGIPKKLLYPCCGILHFLIYWLISSHAATMELWSRSILQFLTMQVKKKRQEKIVPGSFWKSGSIPLPFMSLWCGVTYFPTVITTPDPSSSSNTDWIKPCLKYCTLNCQEEVVREQNIANITSYLFDFFFYYLPSSKRSRTKKETRLWKEIKHCTVFVVLLQKDIHLKRKLTCSIENAFRCKWDSQKHADQSLQGLNHTAAMEKKIIDLWTLPYVRFPTRTALQLSWSAEATWNKHNTNCVITRTVENQTNALRNWASYYFTCAGSFVIY